MNIQPVSSNTFKGYDARPLRGFLMSANCYGIADEMHKIGQKEGFRIYSPFGGKLKNKCNEIVPPYSKNGSLWAQDYWTIAKGKLFSLNTDFKTDSILNFFRLKYDITEKATRETPQYTKINEHLYGFSSYKTENTPDNTITAFLKQKNLLDNIQHKSHISGGNLFIVKDGRRNSIFVGEDELEKYDTDEIQGMYGAKNVIVLPQMDYHLDLFIRPLDNKRVLLADDKMTVDILYKGLNKLGEYCNTLPLQNSKEVNEAYNTMLEFTRDFLSSISRNNLAQADEIGEILEDNGFDVIRVPGRIYETRDDYEDGNFLRHYCNFINANAFQNKSGELVYITNKSNINEELGLTPELSEKIGFNFEQEFVNSISKYINPEHIYFIDGDKNFISKIMLTGYQGGIHCVCSEVPI